MKTMALEITQTVRRAIENGEPLKASDVLALCATCDQVWSQLVDRLTVRTGQKRREYMQKYMVRYRQAKREAAQLQAANTDSETQH